MGYPVTKKNIIPTETRSLISKRYKAITKAINREFWNIVSDSEHSRYVGSYGRGTAIDVSDLDVLFELPDDEYERFTNLNGNGPSRLLQAVKNAIMVTYPTTNIKADGQVVVIKFSDGMKFEILPAFRNYDYLGRWKETYKYPDTHMGGNWMTTNPLAEQEEMKRKNSEYQSNGLLFDTCKHIRRIRSNNFSSYHLSGILIDSFVYAAIHDWRWDDVSNDGSSSNTLEYENSLLNYYNVISYSGLINPTIKAPGSGEIVNTDDWNTLGKVLKFMVK